MLNENTCREEILEAVKNIIQVKGQNLFLAKEVITFMKQKGTKFKDSTIETHIRSRCCENAPQNHGVKYSDFRRIRRGFYRLIS